MNAEDIVITAQDGGRFGAYLVTPQAGGPAPGILLIQEIFGVNEVMRALARGLAAKGFAVLCPDLFWRQEPGIQITDQTQADWDRAFKLFQGFDLDLGVADLIASLDHLRDRPGCNGRVATVGYCLGGQLAYLMACRSDVDAAVGYYGVYIQDYLAEAENIRRPLMLHMGGHDQFVPPEAQEAMVAALDPNPRITLHRYARMDHAFAREGGEHYDREAAELANQRSLEFLRSHLA